MEENLSTQQVTLWHDAFNNFDYNSTGSIECCDLPNLIKAVGQSYDEEDLAEYTREFGVCLSFAEFLIIIRKIIKDREEEKINKKELKDAFKCYDKDGNGHIRASDFREILRNLDGSQTEEELDDLIAEFDSDRSGTIDLEEFLNAMAKK
ncbi:hypothetical protein PPYR_09952 [Photinus pyralis]|uniref:EF-hand domain-containing protein n=1 Tax=Photinus pyralis TaxID=7054 RepID=A0A5N4ABA2_PHOPY|nr:troponin C-like [Photinus pyralis]XP_031349639.1 troponin C-like [Photinus pyralis]KAB0794605.1 hypothetical protein PPYR_11444 [Photinus pyralis]KAB0795891.1 hypothetical protein PPYR_09952 [Photinus pyralis]